METLSIRQELINQLVQLTLKHKSLSVPNTTNVDWKSLKAEIQKKIDKLKDKAKAFEVMGYICLTVVVVIVLVKWFINGYGPDLNKGALLILLTGSNLVSAFRQKIQVKELEKQILLLDILEMTDVNKEVNVPE